MCQRIFFSVVAEKKFTTVSHYSRIAWHRNAPAPVKLLDQEAGAM